MVDSFFATLGAEEFSGIYRTHGEGGNAITIYIVLYNPARPTLDAALPVDRQLNAGAWTASWCTFSGCQLAMRYRSSTLRSTRGFVKPIDYC